MQGLRRYYAARVTRDGQLQIVQLRDAGSHSSCAEPTFPLVFEKNQVVTVQGTRITASFDEVTLQADDETATAFRNGGIGLLIAEGALSTDEVRVGSA